MMNAKRISLEQVLAGIVKREQRKSTQKAGFRTISVWIIIEALSLVFGLWDNLQKYVPPKYRQLLKPLADNVAKTGISAPMYSSNWKMILLPNVVLDP